MCLSKLNKIIDDTLKIDGKWSRKSLTMFMSFGVCIISWILQQVFGLAVEEFIFMTFMGMAGGMSAMNIWQEFKNSKNDKSDNKES